MYTYKPLFGIIHIVNLKKIDGTADYVNCMKATTVLHVLKGSIIKASISLSLFEPAFSNAMYYWKKRGELSWSKSDELQTPAEYLLSEPRMHAEMFVFALDEYQKVLENLKKVPTIKKIAKRAASDLNGKFPDLLDIRNSAHHVDQRIQFKGKKGADIQIHQENTMGMTLGLLEGTKLVYTTEHGKIAKIDICEMSLNSVVENFRNLIQEIEQL